MDYRDKILNELRIEIDSKLDVKTKQLIEQYVQQTANLADHCWYSDEVYERLDKKEYGHAVAGMYSELMMDIVNVRWLTAQSYWETLVLTPAQKRKMADFERTKSRLFGYIQTAYEMSKKLQSKNVTPTGNKNKDWGQKIGRNAYDIPDFLTKSEFDGLELTIQKAKEWYEFSFYETIFSEDYFLTPIKGRGGNVKDSWNEEGIPNLINLLAAAGLNKNRISYYLVQAADICGITRAKDNNPRERIPIKQGAMNKRVADYFKNKQQT